MEFFLVIGFLFILIVVITHSSSSVDSTYTTSEFDALTKYAANTKLTEQELEELRKLAKRGYE